MKKIPLLLFLSVLLWHCNEPPQPKEGLPNPITQPESLEVPPDTFVDVGQHAVVWYGRYFFENPGGVAGKWGLGNEFYLKVKDDPELVIASFSMVSMHGTMKVEVEANGDTLFTRFKQYIKGNGWDDFAPQEPLFYLVRNGDALLTHWQSMQPTYGDLPNKGSYFEAFIEWPDGRPDL